jgi:putative transposase
MPWKNVSDETERRNFACEAKAQKRGLAALCRAYGISRKTGYKWRRRYERDPKHGLEVHSRRPHQAHRWPANWRRRLLAWRVKRPTWGAEKLHDKLRRVWPRRRRPSVRTLERWLAQSGVTRRSRHRAKAGPVQVRPAHLVARRPNDVWTVDFKGRTWPKLRQKLEPLTVFDLATRYGLAVRNVPAKDYACTRRVLLELFALPRAIQVDNGPPFGSEGPLGLTRLTAEWVRQGIQVQFGRPAAPQDNAAHERWHLTLQEDVTRFPSLPGETFQAKFDRCLHIYNTDRAHQTLGLRRPVELYRDSLRPFKPRPPRIYPATWRQLTPNAKGYLWWAKKQRLVGLAFAKQLLGFRFTQPGQCEVYLDHLLLGIVVATDQAGLRPVQLRSAVHANEPTG